MKNPGLYIHIPFCRSKCPYCAFFSVASTLPASGWLDAFGKEVLCYKDRFRRFDSLYFGGGTPTVLEADALWRLMNIICTHFTFDSDPEITIEANPCDLTPEKISALKTMGFNRVSVGVQSFDNGTLSFLGRSHTVQQAEKAVLNLRAHGFQNISIDLIFGFEGQQMNQWMNTLKRAVSFRPEHLSCYQLTLEKKTLFGKLRDRGLLQSVDEKQESDFFLATSQFLEDNGYIHYEISSFAAEEIYYSRHNYKYWLHTPYLGLGPAAHSFHESSRWWNVRSVKKYCEALNNGNMPIEDSETLTEEQLRFESIMLGLRTRNGLDQNAIINNHQSGRMLCGFQDSGFLRVKNGRIVPTTKGFLVADYLTQTIGAITN